MTPPTTLTLRRDYLPATRDLPGMDLGSLPLDADRRYDADALFRSGARHAVLDGVVDLAGPPPADGGAGVVGALGLVRDLTAWGIVVDWAVRLPEPMALPLVLGHLFPPLRVLGPAQGDEIADVWRRKFSFGKCFWRRGQGFVEIRDRRTARHRRQVIDDRDLLSAIPHLADGPPIDRLDPPVRDWLRGSGLGLRIGDHVWWAPYRIRRWPSPPLAV
jgi:uncharacterized protein DUF5825